MRPRVEISYSTRQYEGPGRLIFPCLPRHLNKLREFIKLAHKYDNTAGVVTCWEPPRPLPLQLCVSYEDRGNIPGEKY